MADTLCFYSKVRNMSGARKAFSFLPPHGKTLDPGEEYSFPGRLDSIFATPSKAWQLRKVLDILATGDLVLVQDPAPRVFDLTLDATKVLTSVNGTVTASNPCEGGYSSSIG